MGENHSKRLNLCVITTWPPYMEGIALYSAKLYREIAAFAHIEVIANKVAPSNTSVLNENGITIHRIWSRDDLFSLFRVFKHAMQSRAQLIHMHHGWLLYGRFSTFLIPLFLLVVRLTKKPVILTMHSVIKRNAKICSNGFLNNAVNLVIFALTRVLAQCACKIIVHNQLMKKTLEEDYGCEGAKVIVIPHGVVKARLKPYGGNSSCDTLKILSLGFRRKEKKLEHLIQGFYEFSKEIPNAKLFLVGGHHPHDACAYSEKIVKLVKDLKLEDKVKMIDFVSEEELDQLISDSDFIILVSTNKYFIEASGALARVADFGKPVVCSRVPKFYGELADGCECVMVTPGNVEELVKAMKMLAENGELRQQLAFNLKRRFSNRYWSDVAKMHLVCYYSSL